MHDISEFHNLLYQYHLASYYLGRAKEVLPDNVDYMAMHSRCTYLNKLLTKMVVEGVSVVSTQPVNIGTPCH